MLKLVRMLRHSIRLEIACIRLIRYLGDSWTNRYKSLKLHTPKDYSQLPFRRWFTKDKPYYLSAEEVASAYRDYAAACNLNIWCSASVESATWKEETRTWAVLTKSGGGQYKVTCRHLVFAIAGTGQEPKMPEYPNSASYSGTALHSVKWSSAEPWAGKRGVVIGAGTTGHDVAKDMVAAGLSRVTMVQRSPTSFVMEAYGRILFDSGYNEHSDIDQSDRAAQLMPSPVARSLGMAGLRILASQHEAWFDELECVGLKINRYPDLQHHFFEVRDEISGLRFPEKLFAESRQ